MESSLWSLGTILITENWTLTISCWRCECGETRGAFVKMFFLSVIIVGWVSIFGGWFVFPLFQGDSGGPLMCKQDGSWFQAAVLSLENTSNRRKRASMKTFEKLSYFQSFLTKTLGPLLSPATVITTIITNTTTPIATTNGLLWSGVTMPHSSSILLGHLLLLALCLQVFR